MNDGYLSHLQTQNVIENIGKEDFAECEVEEINDLEIHSCLFRDNYTM